MNTKVDIAGVQKRDLRARTTSAHDAGLGPEEMDKVRKIAMDEETEGVQDYSRQVKHKYGAMGNMEDGKLVWGGDVTKAQVQKQKYKLFTHSEPLVYSFCSLTKLEQLAQLVPRSGPDPVLERMAREKQLAVEAAIAAAEAVANKEAYDEQEMLAKQKSDEEQALVDAADSHRNAERAGERPVLLSTSPQ